MDAKPLIMWLIDGKGWGYDNMFGAIVRHLPQYRHVAIFRSAFDTDEFFLTRIRAAQPEIIMMMNPGMFKWFPRNFEFKTVIARIATKRLPACLLEKS